MDLTGIDIVYHVLNVLKAEFGDAYHPCPLIKGHVTAGDLGVKTGRGFYDHSQK